MPQNVSRVVEATVSKITEQVVGWLSRQLLGFMSSHHILGLGTLSPWNQYVICVYNSIYIYICAWIEETPHRKPRFCRGFTVNHKGFPWFSCRNFPTPRGVCLQPLWNLGAYHGTERSAAILHPGAGKSMKWIEMEV